MQELAFFYNEPVWAFAVQTHGAGPHSVSAQQEPLALDAVHLPLKPAAGLRQAPPAGASAESARLRELRQGEL